MGKQKKMVAKKKRSKKTSISMKCKDHVNYNAIYPPKTDCIVCWKIYATNMRIKNKELKVELKRLKDAKR